MNLDTVKREAERLSIGIHSGWLPVNLAVTWADHLIASEPEVPTAVLDIALGSRLTPAAMASLLSSVPGRCVSEEVIRLTLGELLEWVDRDTGRSEQAAGWLHAAAVAGDLSSLPFYEEAYSLDDGFYLIRQGYVTGGLEHARDEVISFLTRATAGAT